MRSKYPQILVGMALIIGLSTGCKMQESDVVTDLKNELAKAQADRNRMVSENDSLKANLDTLRKDNEDLRKQLAGKQ